MIENKLSVNPDKAEYLLFKSKNISVRFNININLNDINFLLVNLQKPSVQFFNLSMDKHVSFVAKTSQTPCLSPYSKFRP